VLAVSRRPLRAVREVTRTELLAKLAVCAANDDAEVAHRDADDALLEYINDPDVTAAWSDVYKWFA
jgi:hypothetical protein